MKSIFFKFLNYGLYFLAITSGLFAANGDALFGDNPLQKLSATEIRAVAGLFFFSFLTLIIINIIRKKYKPSWVLVCLLFVALTTGLVSIATFKESGRYFLNGAQGQIYSFDYSIDFSTKMTYSLRLILMCLTTFLIIDFTHQIFDMKEFLLVIAFGSLGIIFIFMIISYFTEWNQYISLFENLHRVKFVTPKSVFMNSNVYAVIITLATFSIIYLHIIFKKWWILLPIIFVYVNLLYTWCRTLIFLDSIVIVAYLICAILKRFGKSKKSVLITTASIIVAISIIIGLVFLLLQTTIGWDKILDFLLDANEYMSVKTRVRIWQKAIIVIGCGNWATGTGFGIFNNLLFNYNILDTESFTGSAHNAALEFLGTGGIVMLATVLIIVGMCLFLAIKNFKKDKNMMVMVIILVVFSILYSVLESGFFVFPKTYGFALLTFYIIPPVLSLEKSKIRLR